MWFHSILREDKNRVEKGVDFSLPCIISDILLREDVFNCLPQLETELTEHPTMRIPTPEKMQVAPLQLSPVRDESLFRTSIAFSLYKVSQKTLTSFMSYKKYEKPLKSTQTF